jgi:hypothetical protein
MTPFQHRRQCFQGLGDVADQFDGGAIAGLDISLLRVDMNDLAAARAVPDRGIIFDSVVADRDDQVRRSEEAIRRLVGDLPDPAAKIIEQLRRNGARGLERSDHGEIAPPDEVLHGGGVDGPARQQASRMTGFSAASMSRAASARAWLSVSAGPKPVKAGGDRSAPWYSAAMMSFGRLTNAAPGRPDSAARKALDTTSTIECGDCSNALNFVTGFRMDTESIV